MVRYSNTLSGRTAWVRVFTLKRENTDVEAFDIFRNAFVGYTIDQANVFQILELLYFFRDRNWSYQDKLVFGSGEGNLKDQIYVYPVSNCTMKTYNWFI